MLLHDWLRAFAVFADHLNLTRAARELHVTQPALHAQLRKLSEALGEPLYRRVGRQLELTPAGTNLAAFARELRERCDLFLEEAKEGSARPRVVLAAGEGAFLYLIGEAVGRFAASQSVRLQLLTRDRGGTLEAVRNGTAHLGVTTLDEEPADLESEVIAEVGQCLAVPDGHALAGRRSAALVDLAGERLILPPEGRPQRTAVVRALAAANLRAEVAVEAAGWELMLHFVRLGLGVAVVNECCRLPEGTSRVPIVELGRVSYRKLKRRGSVLSDAGQRLWASLGSRPKRQRRT